MTFLSSVELPTTAPFPTMAFPRMNAQWRISASSSMMHGPLMHAVGATFADFAIQIFSPRFSNLSSES